MPKRSPFDDLSTMASASAAAKNARDLMRGGLDDAIGQLAGQDVVSALDYASPMRSVFDELGGAIAPMRSPASAPKALAAPRPRPAHAAPEGQGASPPTTAPMASAPVTIGEIGKRVRAARKAMGMTQQRFADLAGVGRRFLIELEQGKPSLEVGRVLAVCHAAGIKLGFLT